MLQKKFSTLQSTLEKLQLNLPIEEEESHTVMNFEPIETTHDDEIDNQEESMETRDYDDDDDADDDDDDTTISSTT